MMSALHLILFAVTFTRNILIRSYCCVFACVEKTSRWRLACPKASSSILKSRATRGGFTRNQHTWRSSLSNYYLFHRSSFWMAIGKNIYLDENSEDIWPRRFSLLCQYKFSVRSLVLDALTNDAEQVLNTSTSVLIKKKKKSYIDYSSYLTRWVVSTSNCPERWAVFEAVE